MKDSNNEAHHEEDSPFGELGDGIHEADVINGNPLIEHVSQDNLPPIADGPPRLAINTSKPQASISLMAAQAEYLVALHNYIHDPDLTTLRRAQEAFINAQATYIHLADDRLLAEVQEQIIGVQLKALRKLGAV